MAKKHKNLENILIQWDGDLSHPQAGDQNQNIPDSVDITWGGYVPCWYNGGHSDCVIEDMYYEDFIDRGKNIDEAQKAAKEAVNRDFFGETATTETTTTTNTPAIKIT